MNATRSYRGKYPNNVRAVWSGKDRIIHIETMAGDKFTCTGEQARYVNPRNLPNPGEDSTPYRNASAMPIASVTVDASTLGAGTAIAHVTPAHRIAAIRRFCIDATPDAESDWIAHCIDSLQTAIGIIDGANVARACGYTV